MFLDLRLLWTVFALSQNHVFKFMLCLSKLNTCHLQSWRQRACYKFSVSQYVHLCTNPSLGIMARLLFLLIHTCFSYGCPSAIFGLHSWYLGICTYTCSSVTHLLLLFQLPSFLTQMNPHLTAHLSQFGKLLGLHSCSLAQFITVVNTCGLAYILI